MLEYRRLQSWVVDLEISFAYEISPSESMSLLVEPG